MLNKLQAFIRQHGMIAPGDTVICAVSGGADSMALLFAMYLLAPRLGITLEAAHFNHNLRGEESDRDASFVAAFCADYKITLHVGSAQVVAGEKGLEAAAREARYHFFRTLSGKIATAHTADDNAETVLMHMVRGTGLKGLGGITPVFGNLIRPMLTVTRQDVMDFLAEYHVPYVDDSTNSGDDFLRNRLRHHVMPLLKQENPKLAENLSAMALRLRQDETALADQAQQMADATVTQLRQMQPSVRARVLSSLLEQWGVKEPESQHVELAESLVFSDNPSARASFPGGVTVCRNYDRLERLEIKKSIPTVCLPSNGSIRVNSITITTCPGHGPCAERNSFTVVPEGTVVVRARLAGDTIRLPGGTKSLKKLFIDNKIPENNRMQIPVIADEKGVLGVYGFGANLDRLSVDGNGIEIQLDADLV